MLRSDRFGKPRRYGVSSVEEDWCETTSSGTDPFEDTTPADTSLDAYTCVYKRRDVCVHSVRYTGAVLLESRKSDLCMVVSRPT